MAKYEKRFRGNFQQVLEEIDRAVLEGSSSAALEESSDMYCGEARCAVRVYERYSWSGGNRVSLSVLLLETAHGVRLSAIASGGSQAMFLKLHTFGEEAFLESISEAVARYQ